MLNLPHEEHELPNGLRIFLLKYPSQNGVAYQITVKVGSRNEIEKGKTGFAHFFEHLMFRGTKKRSGKEFGNLYAKIGAENNAWTWFDMTSYHGTVASHLLPQILEAEGDRFMNLYFDEKMLRDEAGAVLGEYNKNQAQPDTILEEKMQATAFTEHPYSHTTMGYKEDVLKFTERYQDVWPFFKRNYRPGNTSIVIVGDIDFPIVLKSIETHFGAWKNPEIEPIKIPEEPKQTETRKTEVTLTKPSQTRMAVAYKIPAFTTSNTDAAVLGLISEIEFSESATFQKTFRFEKQWLDSVDANPIQMVDPGLWTIQIRFSKTGEGHEAEVLVALDSIMDRLKKEPIDSKRLTDAKKRFRNQAIMRWFSSSTEVASAMAWYTTLEPDVGVLDRVLERAQEVTSEKIQDFSGRFLVDTGKTIVTLRGAKP